MIRKGQSTGLAAGLMASALAGAIAGPADALAQGNQPAATAQRPFATTVRPQSRSGAGIDQEPAVTAPTDAPVDPNTIDPAADPGDEPPPRLRVGRRPIVDGDPNFPPEPRPPIDGVIDNNEPAEALDGVDPGMLDTRDPEDIAAFERPAAGFDPDLFLTEIEPILDRRPARLARFEPFQAVGVRVGSFTVFPEAEIGLLGQNNLFRSSSKIRRDVSFDVRPVVRVVSNWRVHALEFRSTGFTTFHNEFKKENDKAYLIEARGRLDISRRTNLVALTSEERTQEVRGSINAASATGQRANIDTQRAALTLNHTFNRLSVQIRGSLTQTDFAPVDTGNGVIASNAARDNMFREAAARATWAFKPTLQAFTEAVVNEREYKEAPADGIIRNSTGDRVRAGIAFGQTSQIVRGEVSAGYAQQRFEDSRLPAIAGGIFDANLAWRMTGLTSLLLTARSDITESTLVGSGGALSQSAGVELRHAFRRQLIGTAAALLTKTDYQGVDLHERALTSTLGLEYFFNREVTLFSRYQHVDFESTNLARNYNADEVRLGLRVRL